MKTEKPLISILLPVHNSEETLEECIMSLLNQTYRNIEIIAMDDFSKDKSLTLLRKLKKMDNRLKIHRNVKRYGISVTLNRLVKLAKGSFIAFMDTDDFSSPNRIRRQLNFLLNNQGAIAVGSQCTFINENNKKIGRSDFPTENELISQNLLHGISMQFETVLLNKTMLPKDVLRFNTNSNPFIYSDIFIKLMPYGKFANLDQFLHFHRNNPHTYLSDVKRNITSLIKLWIKSKALYDYTPPFRSFFSPLIKSI